MNHTRYDCYNNTNYIIIRLDVIIIINREIIVENFTIINRQHNIDIIIGWILTSLLSMYINSCICLFLLLLFERQNSLNQSLLNLHS
jgi:hypothetical protein